MYRPICFALMLQLCYSGLMFGQDDEDPAPVRIVATNNAGFLETGVGGPDNLVLMEFAPIHPPDEDTPPDPPVPGQFFVIGELGQDMDGDGDADDLGRFSGLEWVTGIPGDGSLIGCVIDDDAGDGEFYEIDPDTAEPTFIGQTPLNGQVISLVANGSGYAPVPLPFCTNLIGGSGTGLCISLNVDANGDATNIVVVNPGQGYQAGDIVRLPGAAFQDATFAVGQLGVTAFDELAFNPALGRMFGVINNPTDDGDFGQATMWMDSGSDGIPDQFVGNLGATLIGGFDFDEAGLFYFYDAIQETLVSNLLGPTLVLADVGFPSSELVVGNGLTVVGPNVIISTDTATRFNQMTCLNLELLIPDDIPVDMIPQVFFTPEQNGVNFVSDIVVGGMVPAAPLDEPLPAFFPSSVGINNGSPVDNAVLEAVVIADDLRFCIAGTAPTATAAPIDLSFVFTIPNSADLTELQLDVESQANVGSLENTLFVLNLNTGEFEAVGSGAVNMSADSNLNIDLSTRIADFVDPLTGTMSVRLATSATAPTVFFPWQLKIDSVLVLAQ